MATSTLVVMILGILIIAGGIAMLASLTKESETIQQLTTSQRQELRRFMTEGQLVAAAPANEEITAGSTATFGIAINNRLDTAQVFTLRITGKDKEGALLSTPAWQVNFLDPGIIQKNEQKEFLVTIKPNKSVPSGIYIFIVEVEYDLEGTTTPYDAKRSFTVRVQ